jgi:acyl-CoA thioesterase-1
MADFKKLGKGVTGALSQAKQIAAAEKAMSNAAESAGMKAPVTANKPLTNLQDFHTSFGDSVRKRAADMQAIMDSFNYKYDKGQRVFTEDSARKNWPPMTVLGRVLEGNRIMREDPSDFLSKKIIDEATGKAKRTPHEPGYKVRLEHSPDNWSEFVIPESAIKGNVDMARGGLTRMAEGGESIDKSLKRMQNYSVSNQGEAKKPNELSGVVLAGASWLAGDEKTKLAKQAFGEDVTNTAVGGYKTADVLNQLNVFERDGGTFAPNTTVVLDIGANDIATGVDPAITRANLDEIVSRLGESGVNIILSAQPFANSFQEAIDNPNLVMNEMYSEIAESNPNVTLVDAMSGMLNQKDLMDESGFHLNSDDAKLAYLNKFADAYKSMDTGNQEVTGTPQQVEVQQDPIKQEFQAVISQAEDPVVEQRSNDPIKQEFQEIITQDPAREVEQEPVRERPDTEPSTGYSYAQQNQGLDSYYQAINDYLSQERTQDEIQAAMEQYGVSQADIDAARGSGAGRFDESYATEQYKRGGKVLHMADAGRVSRGVTGALTKAKEMAKAKKASESKIAEVLEAQQAPMTRPQGTGLPLMPRDQGMYTPREQKDLPRMPTVDKARAAGKSPKYNERMQDLLDSPTARKKVDSLINKGKDLDMKEWYGTEPLRQVAMDAGRTPEQFESLMAQLASASQRNPVDKQNQMGSYLYHLSETGQLPENSLLLTNKLKKALKEDPSLAEGRQLVELPKGYGSLAQGDIFNRAVMIGQGDIAGALPPNKKLGTFYENLLGNLQPVTVDVNAVRGPIIERGDPRWLTSKLVEKDETGKVTASYKPREMFDTGEMTMREAKQRPGFWEAAPSGSEYAGFEDLWQRGAKRHGVAPAEAQALGWYGSADVTALKTKPENYVDNLERLIKRTAEQTGKSPTEVMNDMVTGKGFLRKEGGAVDRKEDMSMKLADLRLRAMVDERMGMAKGGRVSVFDAPAKRMSEGGSSGEPTAKEIAKALGELAVTQGKEEYESFKKPRAATDIGNRGILAPALGLPVDMMNMGLSGVDALTGLMGKPTRLSSEKPFAGSEHIKDLMDRYGVTSGEDRPMTETMLSLFSPTGMIKGAQGMTKGAVKAADAMRRPRTGAMREKTN